jgi:hypothetical protein
MAGNPTADRQKSDAPACEVIEQLVEAKAGSDPLLPLNG